jgi:hypothetical protein
VVKGNLRVEFIHQDLTSYGGLELLRRYFRLLDLHRRLRQAFSAYGLGGDYGAGRLVLLVIALFVVGARRLEHLRSLAHDPLVARLCGLARIPTDRTVVNWLKQFTQAALQAVITLNSALLYEQIERLGLSRLTIDVDGTVIRTGGNVAWAFRGFNPHHRKDPSYYPLLAHLAQTGQILRLRNRPGNVHDSRGAERFLRELIRELRGRFGRALPLEFRMDAALFQREILELLAREGCEYAIKVGFWKWVGLKALVAAQRRWHRVTAQVSSFETQLPLEPWGLTLRVVIYRKRVHHESRKNFQLDLFSRRRAFRVLGRDHEQGAQCPRLVGLHRRPGGPGEDRGRAQGGVRPGRGPHPPLRGQQRLAAVECPRPQPDAEFPTPDTRRPEAPVAQADLRLRPAEHADAPLPADRSCRSAGPHRRPTRAAPHLESGDSGSV